MGRSARACLVVAAHAGNMTRNGAPVVVGYDGSPDAELALTWALRTAESEQRPLRIVIVGMPPSRVPLPIREYEEQAVLSALDSARDAAKAFTEVQSELIVEYGSALRILLRVSRDARIAVVGSRGHGPGDTHWLGSVSQHLAGHARCPVAVIRPTRHPYSRQILVGIDGSPPSVRALHYAAVRASATGESVLAAYAYQYPRFSGGGLGALPSDIDTELTDGAERLAAELVAGIAIDFPDLDLRSTAVVGRPGRVLARLSDNCSMVVVGARGRTPVEELLLGSVSQTTLQRAQCPVVVVR